MTPDITCFVFGDDNAMYHGIFSSFAEALNTAIALKTGVTS